MPIFDVSNSRKYSTMFHEDNNQITGVYVDYEYQDNRDFLGSPTQGSQEGPVRYEKIGSAIPDPDCYFKLTPDFSLGWDADSEQPNYISYTVGIIKNSQELLASFKIKVNSDLNQSDYLISTGEVSTEVTMGFDNSLGFPEDDSEFMFYESELFPYSAPMGMNPDLFEIFEIDSNVNQIFIFKINYYFHEIPDEPDEPDEPTDEPVGDQNCPHLSTSEVDSITGEVSLMEKLCEKGNCLFWIEEIQECAEKIDSDVSVHLHKSHWHAVTHESDSLDKDPGDESDLLNLPIAPLLVAEFNSNEDLDGDGKIYGKDFKITLNENTPKVLMEVYKHPKFTATVEIDWLNYLQSLED